MRYCALPATTEPAVQRSFLLLQTLSLMSNGGRRHVGMTGDAPSRLGLRYGGRMAMGRGWLRLNAPHHPTTPPTHNPPTTH